jgi:hypothetical protein
MIWARQLELALVSNGLGFSLQVVCSLSLISELPPAYFLNVINPFIFIVQITVSPDLVWFLHPKRVRSSLRFCFAVRVMNIISASVIMLCARILLLRFNYHTQRVSRGNTQYIFTVFL